MHSSSQFVILCDNKARFETQMSQGSQSPTTKFIPASNNPRSCKL